MERFSFFFSFYGLILGLATAELLGGFAAFVRARAVRRIGLQTGLLAVFIFIAITGTWIDAWNTLQAISLDLADTWAPILIATGYYLAAAAAFPSDPADFQRTDAFFAERKRFVVGMLIAAEFLVAYTFRDTFARIYRETPAWFWFYTLPMNLMVKGGLLWLFFVRSRRANILLLSLLIFLFLITYWENGAIGRWMERRFGD